MAEIVISNVIEPLTHYDKYYKNYYEQHKEQRKATMQKYYQNKKDFTK